MATAVTTIRCLDCARVRQYTPGTGAWARWDVHPAPIEGEVLVLCRDCGAARRAAADRPQLARPA